jgi:glycosyltransferase involved in cell wall biosynthesis
VPSPDISVIVPSVNGLGDLRGCLRALAEGTRGVKAEVLVVDRLGPAVRDAVRAEFPDVRVLEVPPATTIPDMRKLAFEAATAPAVAVIEDHVLVPSDWAARMIEAVAQHGVVGGGVTNVATERVVDWAAYLCEYSHMLPPLPSGPVEWVTGNNTIYRRDLVLAQRQALGNGQWENHLHDALKQHGVTLYSRPDIVVGHKKHYTFGEYFSQRYLYARSYAGVRVASKSAVGRLAYGVAAMALPPLLFWRVVSRVWGRGVHRAELVRSVPMLGAFVCAWAAGEVVGAWRGAGDSLSKVC